MTTLFDMTAAAIALLVIRARIEDGSSSPLRVDVRLTADTTHGFERELQLCDADAVAEVVRGWLMEISVGEAHQAAPDRPEAVTPASRGRHGALEY